MNIKTMKCKFKCPLSLLLLCISVTLISHPLPAFAWTPFFFIPSVTPSGAYSDKNPNPNLDLANGDENKVFVSITRRIPKISPVETHQAWLEYTWSRGGGLPIVIVAGKKDMISLGHVHSHQYPKSRTLLPLFAEESLLTPDDIMNSKEESDSDSLGIFQQYKLGALGLWKSEIEENSHLGTVSFVPFTDDIHIDNINTSNIDVKQPREENEVEMEIGTLVTWNVTFTTLNRARFWQAVTEQTITDACDNLASYLSEPILYTLKLPIRYENELSGGEETSANEPQSSPLQQQDIMTKKWFNFVWRNGGGLPTPLPPIALSQDGYDRIIIPPFLRERVISMTLSTDNDRHSSSNNEETTRTRSEIVYHVVNKSILFLHSHLGRVRFQSMGHNINNNDNDNDNANHNMIEMSWEVSIRPYRNCDIFIKQFIEVVVGTLATNFKTHIEHSNDDDKMLVDVYAPRGIFKDRTGPLVQIRRDTWVGNVLHAHLSDERSVLEQTKDIFRPYTWGTQYENEKVASWVDGGDIDIDIDYDAHNSKGSSEV